MLPRSFSGSLGHLDLPLAYLRPKNRNNHFRVLFNWVKILKSQFLPDTQKPHARFQIFCIKIFKFLIETIRRSGGVREMDFFWRLWKSHFGRFQCEKFCDFKNFFSCELPMVYTIMVHNRFNFYPSNTWSWAAFCLGGQNPYFQA